MGNLFVIWVVYIMGTHGINGAFAEYILFCTMLY